MKLRYLLVSSVLLVAQTAYGQNLANYDAYGKATSVAPAPTQFDQFDGHIFSMDEQRGVPSFVWADRIAGKKSPHTTPVRAAEWYMWRASSAYRMSKASFSTVYVSHVHDTGRGGIIVQFKQRVNGLEVDGVRMNVLLNRKLGLVAMTGNLHEDAVPAAHSYSLAREDALVRMLSDVTAAPVARRGIVDIGKRKAGYSYYSVGADAGLRSAGLQLLDAARVKPVLYAMPSGLVPAYYVEMMAEDYGGGDMHGYGHIIAGDDGRVLSRKNLVHADSFDYRVWAETSGLYTPLDGPEEEYTPHPTGVPDTLGTPAFVGNSIISMEGFNTNPGGTADPWLPSGATVTTGNNIDAYADITSGDGYNAGDVRADTTSPGTFDYTFDPTQGPQVSPEQIKAAVVQLFYTNNWLHDYFYDSGFNEAAGNAQTDNYGRGGVDGDVLHAQAQDYSGTNNANMSTPADGQSPRMQMYVWDVPGASARALGNTYDVGTAAFGLRDFSITAELDIGDDGMGADVNDGCEPLVNDLTGKIALIYRGSCAFVLKTVHAQAAGAVGIIIINNQPTGAPGMAGEDPTINIGVVSVSMADGAALVNEVLTNPPVSATIERPAQRDGTIDNGIVAHEWGHYFHHRLNQCGNVQCRGQSEGWGDFMALMTVIRDGDNYQGVYSVAGYSTVRLGDSTYFGIRRIPYSSDPQYNALSLRHIQDGEPLPMTHPLNTGDPSGTNNSQVHNTGEVWATILHTGYVRLLEQTEGPNPTKTFDEVKRAMADYITGGLMMAPSNPNFVEQLQAILAVASAQDQTDYLILANAFAERGAGSCASAPPSNTLGNLGVDEDDQIRGEVAVLSATVDDSINSCDWDGVLDADDVGYLTVTVANTGDAELVDTTVSASAANGNISFPSGPTTVIPSIPAQSTADVQIEIAANNALGIGDMVRIDVAGTNTEACDPTRNASYDFYVNYDFVRGTIDRADGQASSWVPGGTLANVWNRGEDLDMSGNNVWHGADTGSPTDTYITSAPIEVGSDNLVLSFVHRYSFEAPQLPPDDENWWDGGVIEISTDGGENWEDINVYVEPNYDATLTDISGNPLSNREAYSGDSPNWPAFTPMTLDFGTNFANQTVHLRFRIGTDAAVGAFGWEIDNLALTGVINQPFLSTGPDDGMCQDRPIANAGSDQMVEAAELVTLDGSESSDPEGDPLRYAWTQTAGPQVMLTDADTAMPTFTAPELADETVLTFMLTVTDSGDASATDMVDITVLAFGGVDAGVPDAGPGPDAGGGPDAGTDPPDPDGGCCQTSAQPSMGDLTLAMLCMFGIAVATRRRRRRDDA